MSIVNFDASSPQDALGHLPITEGRLLDFPEDPLSCMLHLHHTHGDIAAFDEGDQRLVFVFHPEYNRQVLTDTQRFHSRFFSLRGPKNSAQRRLTGALLSMNGSEHKRHRRIVSGPFQKQSIRGYRDALVHIAEGMLAAWQPGQTRDIRQDMCQYMLRVTSSILFGYDMPERACEIGTRIERWMEMNHQLGMGAFVSDPYITASYERLLEAAEDLEEQIRAMIAHRRVSGCSDDVLSLLIQAHDETGDGLSDAEMIGQAAILFGAAHLTTAFSLTWTLFLLAQHPHVAEALANELADVLHGAPPTVAQLDDLPMLERVVKESMRVLPASSYSQRVVMEPVTLGPFQLTRGTPVFFSQFITHHLPIYPDAYRFLPERWLTLQPSPYAYLPFGAGPRLCLGGPLAMQTIKITLATILQRFHVRVEPGAHIDGKISSTMLSPSAMPMQIYATLTPFRRSEVKGNINDLVVLEEGPDSRPARIPFACHVHGD
jgi:cytochrome P450